MMGVYRVSVEKIGASYENFWGGKIDMRVHAVVA